MSALIYSRVPVISDNSVTFPSWTPFMTNSDEIQLNNSEVSCKH